MKKRVEEKAIERKVKNKFKKWIELKRESNVQDSKVKKILN